MSKDIIKVDFDPNRLEPHFNWFAMCIDCGKRWIATAHYKTSIFRLKCPSCGAHNSFASHVLDEYIETYIEDGEGGPYSNA